LKAGVKECVGVRDGENGEYKVTCLRRGESMSAGANAP